MIEQSIILEIEKLLDNKKIIYSKLLSDSFGINCLKIITSDSKEFIVKYYYNNNDGFGLVGIKLSIFLINKSILVFMDLSIGLFLLTKSNM